MCVKLFVFFVKQRGTDMRSSYNYDQSSCCSHKLSEESQSILNDKRNDKIVVSQFLTQCSVIIDWYIMNLTTIDDVRLMRMCNSDYFNDLSFFDLSTPLR